MLKQHQSVQRVGTRPKSFCDITSLVQDVLTQSGVSEGLCTVFVRHTSASLIIQENCDPSVRDDLETFFSKLIPENAHYQHDDEGPDDMPSHIRSALTRSSESIPIHAGRLVLGTWQGIYLWEHRARAHQREVVVHVLGE